MTLDEYIEHFNLVVVYAKRGGEYATNFSDLDNLIDFNTGVLGYLKELKTLRVELEVLRKAYDLMAKDYCENMGCSFCNHHAKCLEANHFKNLEGKDFLQAMFINEVCANEKS